MLRQQTTLMLLSKEIDNKKQITLLFLNIYCMIIIGDNDDRE